MRLPVLCPPSSHEQDRLLRRDVLAALRTSGYSLLGKLRCEVRLGVVTLIGSVPSFYLKQMAQAVVFRVAKVQGVRNAVTVYGTAPLPRRRTKVAVVPATRRLTACATG